MSRKTGSVPEETKAAILTAAAEEFYTLGFEKASLRSICTKANVTTGAMYGMFKDKEELFESIVSPAAEGIISGLNEHFRAEAENGIENMAESEQEDFNAAERILDMYYENKIIFDIILKNRERQCVIDFFDKLIEILDDQTALMLDHLPADCKGRENFNECTLHWFSHLQVDSMLHILSHDYPKERAKEQFRIIIKFLRGGMWSLAFGEN